MLRHQCRECRGQRDAGRPRLSAQANETGYVPRPRDRVSQRSHPQSPGALGSGRVGRQRLLIVVLILVFAADFFVERHGVYFWENIPGWSAAFGFVSCVAIIFVSKFIGHKGRIMRDEDYYD